jgi:hypothetical protein
MVIVLRNKVQMIHEPHRLLETRMAWKQADAKIGVLLHGKREVEFPVKPNWDSAHPAPHLNFICSQEITAA